MTTKNPAPPTDKAAGLVTPAQAARYLSCSESGVFSLLRAGTLTRVKLGSRMTRVRVSELEKLAGAARD
jgi:excisionase family DNA binding protein